MKDRQPEKNPDPADVKNGRNEKRQKNQDDHIAESREEQRGCKHDTQAEIEFRRLTGLLARQCTERLDVPAQRTRKTHDLRSQPPRGRLRIARSVHRSAGLRFQRRLATEQDTKEESDADRDSDRLEGILTDVTFSLLLVSFHAGRGVTERGLRLAFVLLGLGDGLLADARVGDTCRVAEIFRSGGQVLLPCVKRGFCMMFDGVADRTGGLCGGIECLLCVFRAAFDLLTCEFCVCGHNFLLVKVLFHAARELQLGKSRDCGNDNPSMTDLTAFAPGRVELLGNHTDYNSGVVLSAAIQMGVTATGHRRDDDRIVLSSDGIDGCVAADRSEGLEPRGSWEDYPLGVAEMLSQAGAKIGGFSAHFSATLPPGAGLSSSAALEVSTAVLLTKLFPFDISPINLAKLCRKAENEFVGVNCGLLDQVSSIFGRRDHVVFLDCRIESVTTIPFPATLGLLIVHSGVKHALTGGEYNERREQCFEAAKRLGVPALRDVTGKQLKDARLPDLVKRRAAHIVGENERVFEALDYLKNGQGAEFGRLMTASHRSSMENFENSTPELDTLVEIATALPGCHGARLTGGGFGGAIVALVENDAIDSLAGRITSEYKSKTGHAAKAFPCHASDGAIAAALTT